MVLRFDLLGPLTVSHDGREVALGSVKQRLVLAALLLRPSGVVTADELVAMLWRDQPPASASANLRTYVRGLRRALHDEGPAGRRIVTSAGGYLLRVGPDERDLDRFDAAAARGRQALADGDAARASAELAGALDMWRGTTLAGLPVPRLLARQVRHLEEQRLLTEEDYVGARLATGGPTADVIPRLRALLHRHPARQRAWAQLLTALYRTGDVAGALAAYRQARQVLADETGLDPGPELTRLHDDILHHRPLTEGPVAAGPVPERPAVRAPTARPEQLPLAVSGFVGRATELARLDAALDARTGGPTAVVISAVSGMAGIGKTALALHWAHRAATRFPDGHLYVNLRGYDDAGAIDPADALLGFLEALDVPIARVPSNFDARTGLYRSLLASREMLIVLDNARDADQVRPLLPGSGRSMVVVTSRDQLTGLIAAEGARPLTLDVLTASESMSLLSSRLGVDRLATAPDAVAEMIRVTGRLPLALSIVAARVAARPTFPLDAVAAELDPSGTGPGVLADGDIRRVFSWSYRALSADAARLFRLLGLHPGPDLTADAAAAVLGRSRAAVAPLLTELARLHLLTQHRPERYAFHDLLRSYAADLAHDSERSDERESALHRMFDHYLHSAHPAAVLLQPQWAPVAPIPVLPTNVHVPMADQESALAWFTAEYHVLSRVVAQAASTGFEPYSWQLAWALTAFLAPRGLWLLQLAAQRVALDAAERMGDVAAQATANRLLARAASRLGDRDTAEHRLQRAITLYESLDDRTGLAQTLHNYVEECFLRGRPDEALAHGREAIRLYRLAGNRPGECRSLNAVGYLYAVRGDYAQAIASCSEALGQQRQLGDHNGQAATLDSLGFAYQGLGDHGRAAECFEQSVDLFRASADRYHEAETLIRLGEAREAMTDLAGAARAWGRAARIYDDLADPAADEVRRRLAHVGLA
jgi:DNA-binding SARP family transcriptional activator